MADTVNSIGEPSLSDELFYNVRLAFGVSTFTEVLLAMGLKSLILGVSGAESMEEAERINGPLRGALYNARTLEEHNAAREEVIRRVWQLGRLLPPKADDAAFLTDWSQVRRLLAKLPDFATSELVQQFGHEADLGDWYREQEPNHMSHLLAIGAWSGDLRFGDVWKGMDKGFIRSLYDGGHDSDG